MRPLRPAPTSAYDAARADFRFGSYRGRVGRSELERARVPRWKRAVMQKNWVCYALITDEIVAAVAVVHLGYAAKHFFHVYDRGEGRVIAGGSGIAPPSGAHVEPVGSEGKVHVASFGRSISVERRAQTTSLELGGPKVLIQAEATRGPDEMTAIARVPGGVVNVTEKGVLMPLSGKIVVKDRRYDLRDGYFGYDHTSGILARHTAWRWAFAMGHDADEKPFAMNLVAGFVGELECTAWSGDELFALSEPHIDVGDASEPWIIASPELELAADERARHVDRTNLLVVRSRFVQSVGSFRGTVKAGDRAITLRGVAGMIEDQDVLW